MKQPGTWRIFQGSGVPHDGIEALPPPPPWRAFHEDSAPVRRDLPPAALKARFEIGEREIELVNAAIYLRRPLLVTGKPGTGKSSLASAVAHELKLGAVLEWAITTRSTLQEGLYGHDAIARVQEGRPLSEIGSYIKLGPLGTALLPAARPRVLLVDEIDKSDIDLPNDLLHVLEKGSFEIPELVRLPGEAAVVEVRPSDSRGRDDVVAIQRGVVRCRAFPIVVLTSNGERDFPPAFLRRCIRLDITEPDDRKLAAIVRAHLGEAAGEKAEELIALFLERRRRGDVATDQLLNAVYLSTYHDMKPSELLDAVLRSLS